MSGLLKRTWRPYVPYVSVLGHTYHTHAVVIAVIWCLVTTPIGERMVDSNAGAVALMPAVAIVHDRKCFSR